MILFWCVNWRDLWYRKLWNCIYTVNKNVLYSEQKLLDTDILLNRL